VICSILSQSVPQVNGKRGRRLDDSSTDRCVPGFPPKRDIGAGIASVWEQIPWNRCIRFWAGLRRERAITHWLTVLVRVFPISRTGFADIIHRELWGFPQKSNLVTMNIGVGYCKSLCVLEYVQHLGDPGTGESPLSSAFRERIGYPEI